MTIHVQINGRNLETADQSTIADLLRELELTPAQVAVEVNLNLVPRQRHDQYVLQDGDRLEVVTLAGGG